MNPHQSASAAHRAAVNRQNAAHSTGPATPEGKRRASLNALRHALTGQTVVLPEDDLAAYQSSCAQFFAELKPQGLLETKAVQTIADTYWRLDRIRAMENNLFSLGFQEQPETFASDPQIHCALAQAKSLDGRADLFARLSLYEQRLNRTLAQAKAELKQLQQERAKAEEHALKEAAQIFNLKQALVGSAFQGCSRASTRLDLGSAHSAEETNPTWQPEQNGFEFSSRELTAWMRRRQLLKEAQAFEFLGRLPLPAQDPKKEAHLKGEIEDQAP